MEDWQIELISKNLTKLIELTDCHTGLLCRFETCQILGRDDIEKLNLAVITPSQRTREFYNIIKTRKNSFETLLKALEETKQSGALCVLSGESSFDDFQISYDVYSELGRGSYGTVVYKGKIGDRSVAVKMVHSDFAGGVQALHEVKVLRDCDAHENVVRYFGAKRIGKFILIVLELCDISLKEWVGKKYEDIPHVEVLRQMTIGLEWLHSRAIVHRDIKPENVLIIRHFKRVKLSDFGLSRHILEGNSFVATLNTCGTPGWMAKEILDGEQGSQTQYKFTYASDVFSLGCIYYYVLSDGKFAFGDNKIRCQVNILDGKSMIEAKEIQHGCSQNTLFINLMILQNPKSRPTCTKILSYPLFWSQNCRLRFLEMLFTQIGGGMEKFSNYRMQNPCKFNHSAEIRVLRHLGYPANQGIGCLLPFAYTQYSSNQVEKMLEILVSGASAFDVTNRKSVGEANTFEWQVQQSDKQSDSKITTKQIAHVFIKETERDKQNPDQGARGVRRTAEISRAIQVDETIRNRGSGKISAVNDKTILPGSNDLNACEVKEENTKTAGTKTLENKSKQEGVRWSVRNFLQRFTKTETLSDQNQVTKELNELKRLDLECKSTRLLEIVKKGDLSIIKGVLEGIARKLSITEVCNYRYKSLLHVAIAHGDYDVVEYLVNNQGFEDVPSELRFTGLVHDCMKNIHEIGADSFTEKCKILELLFKKAPQLIEAKGGAYEYTPLQVTARREFINRKQVELIEMLLRHNPNVNGKDKDENTPLHLLFYERVPPGNAVEITRLLITHNADPDTLNKLDRTFLHYAAEYTPSLFHEIVVYLVSIHKINLFTIPDKNGWTVLHCAVLKGDPLSETLEILKTHRVDLNALDKAGYSVMFYAILGGRSEDSLRTLIRFGADWTITNNNQQTALHVAAYWGNLDALKLFISLEADIHTKDNNGNTPLQLAFLRYPTPDYDIVKELVNNGADPTLKELLKEEEVEQSINELQKMNLKEKYSRLFEIVNKEDLRTIKGVLEGIATQLKITQVCNEDEKSLLHVAVARGDYDFVEYLVNNQGFERLLSHSRFEHSLVHDCIWDIHVIDDGDAFTRRCRILELLFRKRPQLIESKNCNLKQYTPLHVAANREFKNGKQVELIKMLLCHNPNVNAKDENGNTPLHLLFYLNAVPGNVVELMRLLITHKAYSDALNYQGDTFLHYAAIHASPSMFHEIVVYLVSIHKTSSFTIPDSNGWTVLHWAVWRMKGDPLSETLEILKTHRVHFNALDTRGHSVMFHAIQGKRSEDFLNTLIRFGADWKITNASQQTALYVAAAGNNLAALKLFISLGSDINAKDKRGDTPLHKAVNHDIIKELVNNGADPTLKNNYGESAIDLAKKNSKYGMPEQHTVNLLENASKTKYI